MLELTVDSIIECIQFANQKDSGLRSCFEMNQKLCYKAM